MEALGLIGIVAGLAFLVAAIYKGYSLVIAARLATMIVILFNGLPFIGAMFGRENSYMSELAAFILGNFPVFLFGAILAKYMDKRGAALAIAQKLTSLVGTSSPYRALVSLFVIVTSNWHGKASGKSTISTSTFGTLRLMFRGCATFSGAAMSARRKEP